MVVDDEMVGRKHPEDDHHENCEPMEASAVVAEQADWQMRHEVGYKNVV